MKSTITTETMEDNTKLFESLFERAVDFTNTSYELVKLKAVDKTSDVISTLVPHTMVFFLVASFLLFVNLGLAFWLGEVLGNIGFGFFIVAGFYIISAASVHFFMHKRLKGIIRNYIVKQMMK